MPTITVRVSLDPAANPPVEVQPWTVEVKKGQSTIIWVRDKSQVFDFHSLDHLSHPSFSQLNATGDAITISDANLGSDVTKLHIYTVVVTSNGESYSTQEKPDSNGQIKRPGPFIRNK